ncbi:AAA-like domain-containing protein [Oscillatoria sp. HE19RPO]|uniref:AAA-like domain-containing protein n=1 Tax=Oscillatoria sp. HE19RPO TaxID=2954806 RepID=UPI0020C3EBD3|nr:AAA-like domain-containing protein [Oscillatoria sp. HE19RPO]
MNAQTFQDQLTALKAKKKTYEVLATFLQTGGDFEQTAAQSGIQEGSVRKHLSEIYTLFKIEGRKQKRERLIALFSQYQPELVNPERRLDKVERLTGIVPLGSPFYIDRTEDQIIRQAFELCPEDRLVFCRLRSARGLGKSSLLIRLRDFLEQELGHTVGWVDLSQGTMGVLQDFRSLLKFFTKAVAEEFACALPEQSRSLPDLQKNHWRDDLAPGTNCMDYLEQYVFKPIHESPAGRPLTLIIDGIDSLLGQEAIQSPFLDWLRAWNERKMKRVSRTPVIWSNVVIAYSTEPYAAYEMAGSPLDNVGFPIELKEFDQLQVCELTKRYGLTWHNDQQEIEKLMSWIGGHPELLNRALYAMRTENLTLDKFLESMTQSGSLFNSYLQGYLKTLQDHPALKDCLQKIINGQTCTNQFSIFQLEKSGLINFDAQNQPKPRFKLYEEYFKQHLKDFSPTTDEA